MKPSTTIRIAEIRAAVDRLRDLARGDLRRATDDKRLNSWIENCAFLLEVLDELSRKDQSDPSHSSDPSSASVAGQAAPIPLPRQGSIELKLYTYIRSTAETGSTVAEMSDAFGRSKSSISQSLWRLNQRGRLVVACTDRRWRHADFVDTTTDDSGDEDPDEEEEDAVDSEELLSILKQALEQLRNHNYDAADSFLALAIAMLSDDTAGDDQREDEEEAV